MLSGLMQGHDWLMLLAQLVSMQVSYTALGQAESSMLKGSVSHRKVALDKVSKQSIFPGWTHARYVAPHLDGLLQKHSHMRLLRFLRWPKSSPQHGWTNAL